MEKRASVGLHRRQTARRNPLKLLLRGVRTYVREGAAQRPRPLPSSDRTPRTLGGWDAARELPNFPLEDALQLVHLYAEHGSPKYEKAALRWLERYLAESSPELKHFAEIAHELSSRSPCSNQG